MKTKNNLHGLVWSVFAVILALFCITLFNVKPSAVAKADGESSQIVTLYDPSGETSGNYTTNFNAEWNENSVVEDYTDSPTGKVLHQTINYTQGTESYPALTLSIPYSGDATNYAGYVIWLEYSGNVYSNDSYWGLFNFDFGGESNTISYNKPITFVDENGKINETQSGGWMYHRNNNTAIENSGYTYAYSYAFKGYMIIPDSTLSGTAHAPAADRVLRFAHHYKKTLENVDIKIGMVGFYTDYDALLAELGRCTYSFVDTDGTVIDSATVQPGTEVVAPEYSNSYVKDGKIYTFIGWRGYTDGMTVSEDTTFTASYKVTDFHMVKGASIRTNEGTSGIRYTAEFDEDLYNEIALDDNREFGMLITKLDYYNQAMASNAGDLIAGLNELGSNKYVLITESSANPVKVYPYTTETDVTYRISGALTNIQYDHADWTWMGVGVIVETDGDNVSYTYAVHTVDESARTTSYVASAALNNPTENFTSAEKATLKNYVYKSAAKSAGVTETNFTAQEDKSSYLSDYTLTVGDGFDTQYKFNDNVAGDEAYMTIGDKTTVNASIVNDNGEALDVAYTVSVTDSTVLSVNGNEVTALKNGYATVTIACELFGYSKQLTVYTGSTDAGNRANSYVASNVNASGTGKVTGEIDGQPYYWYQYQLKESAHIYASYPDMSVYYIDYLLSQGYKYLRIPFYFDTTRASEIEGGAAVTAPYFTIWMANGLNGTSGGSSKHIYVNANEWIYYDMDLNHYRMNWVEATGNGADTYGMKKAASSYYQYLNMKACAASTYVYFGNMTFVKDSTFTIDESNDVVSLGEELNLADYYGTDENMKTYFDVDDVAMNTMTAVYKQHNVTVRPNLYTAQIGDGSYTVGSAAAWAIGYSSFTPVEKTLTVQNGLDVSATTLVDVNGITTDVSIGAYTGADELTSAGFNVTQTYVKRYGDSTEVVSDTVANDQRGIFYVDVTATKGAQSIAYEVTLDLYNSTEPVEYESFAHEDSKYAVKVYYAIRDTASEWLRSQFKSYDYMKSTYVTGKQISGIDVYGMDLSYSTYFNFNKWGDNPLDNNTANKTYAKNAYSYDLATGTNGWTDDDVANLKYFAFDGNLIQLNTPMKDADGNLRDFNYDVDGNEVPDVYNDEGKLISSKYTIDSCIYVYVTPRHTKEYYTAFSSTDRLAMLYAEPMTSGSAVVNFLTGVSGDVSAPTAVQTSKQNYSANWQPSLMWTYSGSTITGTGPQSITVETIATYYDAFETMSFPFVSWNRPAGRGASSLSNGVLKLGALIF